MVLQIVIRDKLDAGCSVRIRLHKASDVGIKDDIQGVRIVVSGPGRYALVSTSPSVGIEIVDKAGPRLGHEAGQISVALTFVREGIDSVA